MNLDPGSPTTFINALAAFLTGAAGTPPNNAAPVLIVHPTVSSKTPQVYPTSIASICVSHTPAHNMER